MFGLRRLGQRGHFNRAEFASCNQVDEASDRTLAGAPGPGIGPTGASGRVSGVSGDSSTGLSGTGSEGSIGGNCQVWPWLHDAGVLSVWHARHRRAHAALSAEREDTSTVRTTTFGRSSTA